MEELEHSWVTNSLLRLARFAHRYRLDVTPGYGQIYETIYPFYKYLADGGLLRWIARHHAELSGGHLIDLGANFGVVAAQLAKALSPDAKLLCIEPEPLCFETLRRRFAPHASVFALPLAVGECDRSGSLLVHRFHRGNHRLLATQQLSDEWRLCPTVVRTLDGILEEYGLLPEKVRFLKMDLQGGERNALAGMPRLLAAANSLTLCIEYSPHLLASAETSPAELFFFLRDFGFIHISRLDAWGHTYPVTDWRDLAVHGSCDLLFRKNHETLR